MKTNKMKLFVSLVMNNKAKEEIDREFENAKQFAIENNYEIENSYITDDCPPGIEGDNIGIWYLGKSIEHLANCQAILMCPGSENASGCIVEKLIAEKYGLKIYYL